MSSQPSFNFDAVAAQADKRAAIKRVADHANKAWLNVFYSALERVAHRLPHFTADDVWQEYESTPDRPTQHEPRAAGAVVVRAIKTGLIRPVENSFKRSNRRSCHNRPIQVYESLIYRKD